MATTETPATRDRERTRAAVLAAANHLLADRGTGISLMDVATAAQVSKSGLLHHFPSKDALLLAVTEQALAAFRDDVLGRIDEAEDPPGRLLRAYVRTLCGGSEEAMSIFAPSPLWHGLLAVPGVDALLAKDAEYWRTRFAEDGVPADRALVVRNAAEGVAAASALPVYLTAEERATTERALLAMCTA